MSNAINFAFDLTPEQAIAFLRQKKQFVGKIKQKALYQSALAKATTIARLSSLEMTKDIYQSLETALQEGKSFAKWKKELVAEFERKGWVFAHDKKISRGIDGKLLADPKTGEYFGTPRRLKTIFRVNTQSAYAAGRYQRMMDNIDNRPYWQYSAVGDQRTRPAHLDLNGRIYRYDDPFWSTFYPPNGFNCRCTVIALNDRDLQRKGRTQPDDSSQLLTQVQRTPDKQGNQESTIGFKLPTGQILVTDKGFDYNLGRLSYKPNLDLYPEKLAHQFAKAEMTGAEFKLAYVQLSDKLSDHFLPYKALKDAREKEKYLRVVQNKLDKNFKFAAGVFSQKTMEILETNLKTIWLSDNSLVKQILHRQGQFGFETYVILPEILNKPDVIKKGKDNRIELQKVIDNKKYIVVLKILEDAQEIFVLSFRRD